MDPMKTAPKWGPFLNNYMSGGTTMKGVAPTQTQSARQNPGSSTFYGAPYFEEPMMAEGSLTGENPCQNGYVYINGRCVWNDEILPQSNRQQYAYGPSAGCPAGYQLIDGRCLYAP